MIIYLRHADDYCPDPTFAHDQKVIKNEENEKDIENVGTFLVEKYSAPEMVICSPFQRARDTHNILKKKKILSPDCKFYADTRVGRYFSSREKEAGPEVRKETMKMKPSIYESWEKFKKRVRNHVDQLTREGFTKSRHTVVWVITHTLVIKEVAKYLNFEMPEHYQFLQWVTLRSHGPQYPISFIGVGDGAKDPVILKVDENREKKHREKKREHQTEKKTKVIIKKKGKEKEEEPRRKKRNQRYASDSNSDSQKDSQTDSDNDSAIYDNSDDSDYDGSGNITIEVKEEKHRQKPPKRYRDSPKKERHRERHRDNRDRKDHHRKSKVNNYTVEQYIDANDNKREEDLKYQNRLRGKPLGDHIDDHIKSQPQFRIVKDKFEKAKGGNIDDFINAFQGDK